MRPLLLCLVFIAACKKDSSSPPAPPSSPATKVAETPAAPAAPAAAAPAADDPIATWWKQVGAGDSTARYAVPFDAELRIPAADACPNGGNLWAKKKVDELDAPAIGCLKAAINATALPTTWKDGWECEKFSASKNAIRLENEHKGRKEKLVCGVNAAGVGVFIASTPAGITAVLLSNE
jgi:hypothetical protein